jgi:hypothetical protein
MSVDLSKFTNVKDLQKYCENLTQTNTILQQRIQSMDAEIKHLKELLANAPAGDLESKLKVKEDAEEAILREINKLNRLSMIEASPLEKEDTQKLKMMVEALVAFRNKGVKPEKKEKKEEKLDSKELLRLALQADDEEEMQ